MYTQYLEGKIKILEKRIAKLEKKIDKERRDKETFLLLVLEAGKIRGFNYFSNLESLKEHILSQIDDKIHYVILCRKYRKKDDRQNNEQTE